MRLYLDACAIIYAIEGAPAFQRSVVARVGQADAAGGILITSRLSRIECRTKPLRENNVNLLLTYDTFFARSRFDLADIAAPVIELATELRAKYAFKTPDAIHLATAIDTHADLFITGDERLARCVEVKVEVIKAP